MKDYSSWPQRAISVTSLQLDPENPRIPSTDAELGQPELIAELVEHDDVLGLAKEIVEQGYWLLELLLAIKDGSKSIVVEGNRRLAALKLLLNPNLAPAAWVNRFKKLSGEVPAGLLEKVPVLFAPTREEAAPMIMARHTRTQVEKWSPIMQARFYASLRKEGVTVAQMAKQYGVSASEIAKNLRVDEAYKAACSIHLPAEVAEVVRNPREFEVSTLERIVNSPKARKVLGIDFDSDGKLSGHVAADEFKKALGRIVTDIAKGRIDTRSLNTAQQIEDYVESLGNDAPDKGKPGKFNTNDLAESGPPQPPARGGTKREPTKKNTTRPAAFLISNEVKCRVSNEKIKEVYLELRKLKIDAFPNASGVLLRMFLDISVSEFMDRTGKLKPLTDRLNKDKKKPAGWSPTLNQMLRELCNDAELKIPAQAKKRLVALATAKDTIISVDTLDAIAHNRFTLPNARDLRSLANALEPLLMLALDPDTDEVEEEDEEPESGKPRGKK